MSDDYGLAMQLQWYIGPGEVRVSIPGDGVFQRTVDGGVQGSPTRRNPADILLLPVHTDAGQVWDRIELVETLDDVRHPTTGARLIPYRARIRNGGS